MAGHGDRRGNSVVNRKQAQHSLFRSVRKCEAYQRDHKFHRITYPEALTWKKTTMSSIHEQNSSQSTAIFHRNPGKPPVATSGKGIYITLENGRTLVDAGGGPSVNCLGMDSLYSFQKSKLISL